MSHEYVERRLDILSFAKLAESLEGRAPVSQFQRLKEEIGEAVGEREIVWQVRGELREGSIGQEQVWLHLKAEGLFPLICQRCLALADLQVTVDRSFRFVSTEDQAETEDEDSEEDVLVLDRAFDLMSLMEDEIIMAFPMIPLHEKCPTEVKLAAQDPDFESPSGKQPNPFAVLSKLRTGKPI